MKGLSITVPGISLESIATTLSLPVTQDLQSFGLYSELSKDKNLTGATALHTYSGSLTFDSLGVKTNNNQSGVKLGTAIDSEKTFLVAIKLPETTDKLMVPIVGNWYPNNASAVGAGAGIGIVAQGSGSPGYPVKIAKLIYTHEPTSGGSTVNANVGSSANFFVQGWNFIALTVTSSKATAKNLKTGFVVEASAPAGTKTYFKYPDEAVLLKSVTPAGTEDFGTTKAAFCAVYNRALSNQEIDSLHLWAKKYLLSKGEIL